MNETQQKFVDYLKVLGHYRRAIILMMWDMYTATPEQGYDGMAETQTFFSSRHFELSTASEWKQLLEEMKKPENYDDLNAGLKYTVDHLSRELLRDERIPKDFFEASVALSNKSMRAWEKAKKSSDFSIFAPFLDQMITMVKERSAYTDPGKDPYEVLVNEYEEGMDTAAIDRVFGELKDGLLPLLDRILAAKQPESKIYEGTYDPDAQKKVQKLLLEYIGFNFEAGTTAESEHPFTEGFSRHDVRVTNHYYEHDPISAMFSAIHEGGHAILGQNVAPELEGTAADDCRYLGIHESQSRFFENILGRRKSFWLPIYDKVQELLPDLKEISLDEFVAEVNHVKNSLIRTEADEVTYCLHIILRYEIEQEIFRGNVPIESLPALWNEKMESYLHITPPDDASGVLQDMHWSDGSFGYFPTYLLGTIYDGMFLEAMEKDLGDIDALLEAGKVKDITHWLNENIHQYGCLRKPNEVIEKVCGQPLSAKPILKYFEKKYTEVYNLI